MKFNNERFHVGSGDAKASLINLLVAEGIHLQACRCGSAVYYSVDVRADRILVADRLGGLFILGR